MISAYIILIVRFLHLLLFLIHFFDILDQLSSLMIFVFPSVVRIVSMVKILKGDK